MIPNATARFEDTPVDAGVVLSGLRNASALLKKLERYSGRDLKAQATVLIIGDVYPEIDDYLGDLGLHCSRYAASDSLATNAALRESACLVYDVESTNAGMSAQQMCSIISALKIRRAIYLLNSDTVLADYLQACPESRVLIHPVPRAVLFNYIAEMLTAHFEDLSRQTYANLLKSKLDRLSPRERVILDLVASGMTSKEIAKFLSISHRTVEVHRAHLFEKLSVSNMQDLVRLTTMRDVLSHDCLIHRMVEDIAMPWDKG